MLRMPYNQPVPASALAALVLALGLSACAGAGPTAGPSAPETGLPPAATTVSDAPPTPTATDLPTAVDYNLGETTITQAQFPADSRFHDMPVRLNGVIAVPASGGPHPVVVILHGTHPGCPVSDATGSIDPWPCDPAEEQPNYRGFGYLASALAGAGYVALSINVNAENTFGFGEPMPGERLEQIVNLHLEALGEAAAGGANDFGVELAGRADLSRLAFVGHSRGAEAAYVMANTNAAATLKPAEGVTDTGSGEATAAATEASSEDAAGADEDTNPLGIDGILMIAPATVFADPRLGSPVPLGIILPACDADVMNQEGKHFYEGARMAAEQATWATSAWLEQANHNHFNDVLPPDGLSLRGRPDCANLMSPEDQREFLVRYAVDFLTVLFGTDPAATTAAISRLGLDPSAPVPDSLYDHPARVSVLAPADKRQALLIPRGPEELVTNLVGGAVTEENLSTHYCEEGYATPSMRPGSEPCQHVHMTIPGNPAKVVVSWTAPGGAWRMAIPEGEGDLREAVAIALRAAVDPLSPLNAAGETAGFSVRLTDGAGNTATVPTDPEEPALAFPLGDREPNETFGGELFLGRVPLTAIRVPLTQFEGIDLGDIREIALVFDQSPTGSLFLGDLEWLTAGW